MFKLPCECRAGRGKGASQLEERSRPDGRRRETVPGQPQGQLHRMSHAQGGGSITPASSRTITFARPGSLDRSIRGPAMIAKGSTAPVFLIPCVIEDPLLLYFLRGFRAPVSSNAWAGGETALLAIAPPPVRGTLARSGHLVTESADG